MNEKFERGLKRMAVVDPGLQDRLHHLFGDIAPVLESIIPEFVFGEMYSREGLDPKQRQMLTIASLTNLGDTAIQLDAHIKGALNVGVTPYEVIEVILHCLPYCGFPRVLNAVLTAKKTFAEVGVTVEHPSL